MYLLELDPESDQRSAPRNMVRVLASIRDEVLAIHMSKYGGMSRELAMVASKLDEARQWAITHGEKTGSHVVLDRREILGTSGLPVAHTVD